MAEDQEVGPAAELTPGTVTGVGRYAVGNAGGELFAVTRRCRHLRADLANGAIDDDACLVCPWHGATYDVGTGRMTRGPQGVFAKIPGLDFGYRMLTRVLPLGRGKVVDRERDSVRVGLIQGRVGRGADEPSQEYGATSGRGKRKGAETWRM